LSFGYGGNPGRLKTRCTIILLLFRSSGWVSLSREKAL